MELLLSHQQENANIASVIVLKKALLTATVKDTFLSLIVTSDGIPLEIASITDTIYI